MSKDRAKERNEGKEFRRRKEKGKRGSNGEREGGARGTSEDETNTEQAPEDKNVHKNGGNLHKKRELE